MAGAAAFLKRLYLSLYNWMLFFAWLYVLFVALKTLARSGHRHVYSAVETPLQLAQTAALFEILHGLLGLVRSPVTATVPQIGGRLYMLWGILASFPQTQTHILVTSLVFSWSISEVIRYSFFGCKEALGFSPSWLLWLRYSTFLLFNPIGLSSEAGLIYYTLPYTKGSGKYEMSINVNGKFKLYLNSFYTAIVALALLVPGGAHMFLYMLGQRKRALRKPQGNLKRE